MPPHPDTIVRVFTELSAQQLADHAGAFLARRAPPGPAAFPVAAPGWLPGDRRGRQGGPRRRRGGRPVPYLLAAATHGTAAVIAERLIGPKTSEVPEFAPLLRGLNERVPLAGHVITTDAGHTVRAHATFICQELLAHYVMTVKCNTPKLFAALDALDWAASRSSTSHRNRARPHRAAHHPGDGRPRARPGTVPARPRRSS